MRKIYKSDMIISIHLSNGRRVCFEPTSDGGSYFSTDNLEVQRLLEENPLFGKQYHYDRATLVAIRMAREKQSSVPSEKVADVQNKAQAVEHHDAGAPANANNPTKVIKVASVADAKKYLVDNCDIPSSHLRSKKDILENAKKNNILFSGL